MSSPSTRTDPAMRALILELNVAKYMKDDRPTETGGDWYTLYKQIKATTEDALPDSSVATEWCEFVFKHLTDAGSWNPGAFPKVRAWQTLQYLLHWHNPEPKAQAGRQRGGQAGTRAHTRGMASTRMLAQPMLDMMVSFSCTGTDSFDSLKLTSPAKHDFPGLVVVKAILGSVSSFVLDLCGPAFCPAFVDADLTSFSVLQSWEPEMKKHWRSMFKRNTLHLGSGRAFHELSLRQRRIYGARERQSL